MQHGAIDHIMIRVRVFASPTKQPHPREIFIQVYLIFNETKTLIIVRIFLKYIDEVVLFYDE
jgi:hypothetical protein